MSQGLDWIFSFELKSGKTKKKKSKRGNNLTRASSEFYGLLLLQRRQSRGRFVCEFHGKRLLLQICGIKLPLAPASLRLKDMNVFLAHIFI